MDGQARLSAGVGLEDSQTNGLDRHVSGRYLDLSASVPLESWRSPARLRVLYRRAWQDIDDGTVNDLSGSTQGSTFVLELTHALTDAVTARFSHQSFYTSFSDTTPYDSDRISSFSLQADF